MSDRGCGREGEREGVSEGGRKGEREGGSEGGRKGEKEGERECVRDKDTMYYTPFFPFSTGFLMER